MTQRQWMRDLRKRSPRVHCITSYVTAGDIANMMLVAGGSSVTAWGPHKMEDVTSICSSLVLSLGTLEEKTIPAMEAVGRKAAVLGLPIILDPAEATALRFRRQTVIGMIRKVAPSVIQGSEAEIRVLDQELRGYEMRNTCGVDSGTFGTIEGRLRTACSLKDPTSAVAVITGEEDVVAGRERRFIVRNNHPWMARITGSGCMLDGPMKAFCGLHGELGLDGLLEEAVVMALGAHGLCGELTAREIAGRGGGTGTFRMYLVDKTSLLDGETLGRDRKTEVR